MIQSPLGPLDPGTLNYLVTHVFCPLQLPNGDDHTVRNDHSLSGAVTSAARLYSEHVDQANLPEWSRILRMLENLRDIVRFESLDNSRALSQLAGMAVGDAIALLIRAQNAAVVFRRQQDVTVFESFEVSPMAEKVITTKGKLVCSYPGPAIEIPNNVFDDHTFRSELVNFLFHMNKDDLDLDPVPTTREAQSTVGDTAHPRYISELLTGILRSVGRPANIARVNKRVGDDAVWGDSGLPWRRSSLWLVIRVTLQTSLTKSTLGHHTYKAFMLFFMCCIASDGISGGLSNDLLQFMSTKISRRLRKIGSSAPDWLSEVALQTCIHLRSTLEKRWGQVQAAQRVSPVWTPSQLNLSQDIQLSLQSSGGYIRNSLANHSVASISPPFNPKHHRRGILDEFLSSDGTFFKNACREEPYTALYDVERAVEEGIDAWVDRVTNNDEACEKLELLANNYSSSALVEYRNNPELLSIMMLTMIELWVALDKIAIKEIPMLADYSPEIPMNLLEQFLLSKTSCLDRLRLAHQYLSYRHSLCRWSAFSPEITPDTFAVRFYRGSSRLQCLKTRIEDAAQLEVREKVEELDRMNAMYAEVQREAARTVHEYAADQRGIEHHVNHCRKCSLESECKNMKITVHEWPLPAEQLRAEVVVFELDCPVSFNMWRSTTFHLLVDICSPPSHTISCVYIQLSGCSALKPYLVQHPRSRITLASDVPPIIFSCYETLSIPTTQKRVCVENGLKFYGWGSHSQILASKVSERVNILKHCTHALPTGLYKNLQKYVDTTLHSSNEVMANQADCPVDLSIHEYMVFGHLRSGGLLQWLNVLRLLRARSLPFRRSEVHFLLAQAILQVGPLSDTHWEWHRELQQSSFCHALLEELQSLIRDVETNWLELATMDTISLLLRRLLSSGPHRVASLQAIELLRAVRRKVFIWVQELSGKLMGTSEDEDSRQYLRVAAAVCRSTFDVDSLMIPAVLHSVEDTMVLICCAMLIHNHTPSQLSSLSPYSQLLIHRDRRLSLAVEDTLREVMQADPDDEGINLAVGQIWPGYRPGSKWTPLQSPNSHWFSCTTASTTEERSEVMHYNILDGSLLVNGKPLGRLPNEIRRHPLYNHIFGNQVLDIIPSDIPGMDYSMEGTISDHTVYFALRNNDLVIRTKRKSTGREETMELIPPEKLQGDIPAVFIEGHAHWLNIDASTLEIRPLDTLWKTLPDNWTIRCTPGQYCAQKGREVLVDVRSETWRMVSSLLRPLDVPSNLIISAYPVDPARPSSLELRVALPRYGLSFYVDEDGDLQSQNMRGMVYDENQSIGTFFGLVNRLVLRPKKRISNVVELIPRCVLIPDGDPSFCKDGHHVRVETNTDGPALDTRGSALKPITYQTFAVDSELGCLTGTVSLTNKLYCVYLHALTSGCGADPLTGRSGTEEALSLLRSASCWSIIKFTPQDAKLLSSIASICPVRVQNSRYPRHTVWCGGWSTAPATCQRVEWLDAPEPPQKAEWSDVLAISKQVEWPDVPETFQQWECPPATSQKAEQLDLPETSQQWGCLPKTSLKAEQLGLPATSQRVEWSNLPATSQHHDLYIVSKAIKDHYEKVSLFHETPSSPLFKDFPSQDIVLLERSARRAAYLFPSDASVQSAEPNADVHYSARDLLDGSGEHRAYTAATAVFRRIYTATMTKNILSMVESWNATVAGDTKSSLSYDNLWLAPNLPSVWLEVYQLLRKDDEKKWFKMLFSIPAMAYASPELSDLVPVFVAFALYPQFLCENPPPYASYTISDGYNPSEATLRGYFSECALSFEHSPESSESARHEESIHDLRQRRLQAYNNRRYSDANATVSSLLSSWPCENLPLLSLDRNLYNEAGFISNARHHFSSCFRNLELKEHLIRVQLILESIHPHVESLSLHPYSFHPSERALPFHVIRPPMVGGLFGRLAPSIQTNDRLSQDSKAVIADTSPPCHTPLHRLIATVEGSAENPFQRQYISALRTSAECLEREASHPQAKTSTPGLEILITHYAQCRDRYVEALHDLRQNLGPRSLSERALEQSGQWPRITPYVLFRSLASNSPIVLSDDWKKCLIILALIALELQRTRRLLRLHFDNLHEEIRRELQNEGCDGWNAETYPDWLLIQLQGNFLVRRVQVEVSKEMISPRSGGNTAMQLNMGEGKSSVIVPIVVAVLADGHQLVRVIVPEALTAQMFHILVDRLGGLANRRLYFVPFSRSVQLDHGKASALRELMTECMDGRGILVAQPEHILSFKLLSVERQLHQARDTWPSADSDQLLKLQQWLRSHSRDILDESDEILHVRYQLMYTIGTPLHMEGFPERWTTAQQTLNLVSKIRTWTAWIIPSSSYLAYRRWSRIDSMDIIDGGLPNFNFGQFRSGIKDAIRCFISCENVHPGTVQLIKVFARDTPLWGGLLHLRGLLACGILLFALTERRWRVNYGLAPTCTMLAVPYRAKDVPVQRAEFGHPDIAIVLTSLSYYYGGLSEEQLKLSFEILSKQDDPSPDYALWVQDGPALQESLCTLNGVNTNSSDQWKMLYPLFQRNRATVDFYLSNVVFPKEAKEFPSKLSCSGWDLAEKKERLVTGFSGTNDGQYLLPLHITQRDPDHQQGTNAKVLLYLLQPENQHYMCMACDDGERQSTRGFLKVLAAQDPGIRVLLDVGAQMLDLKNRELAGAWLDINTDASAAIYFSDDDELMVCTRDGRIPQPLHSSPFAQQLDQCVVYLDDAHTRGTDIKFPIGFRAAVTLGPKVTKDRLVQGCMRMRKLGHGHSVIFFAPLEVDRRIRSLVKKGPKDIVDTTDILHWVIHETCDDILRQVPHWVQQGMDHTDRYAVWTSFCGGQLTSQALSNRCLQPEAKKLEDLYAPHNNTKLSLSTFPEIQQRCIELGILKPRKVSMDEEQQREIIHEAEIERQVERPPRMPAAEHIIHEDVVEFITTGVVPTKSGAFCPAFEILHAISDEAHIWSRCVLTTTDFAKTVSSSGKLDEYLRPVLWVVSGTIAHKEAFVILSPYEVNHLMPKIRSSKQVHLHLYAPRVIESMKPCDDLALYNIPAVPAGWTLSAPLMDQLNVFAGQLYLRDYETYIRLCRFLCVYAMDLQGEDDIEVNCDGFIAPNHRPQHLRSVYTFQKSPLDAVKTLVALRRKGMRFTSTHMGRILDGRLLDEHHFRGHDVNDNVAQENESMMWHVERVDVDFAEGHGEKDVPVGCPVLSDERPAVGVKKIFLL